MEGLTRRARQGAAAALARRAVTGVVQLGAAVLLARLLTPAEFGVAALAAAFAALPQLLGDLGMGTYLLQAREVDRALFRRLFGLNLLVSLGLAALQCLLSFAAAVYYGDPRVTGVLLVSALGHPAFACWSLHEKLLRRRLQFPVAASLQGLAGVLSAVGCVALAAMGMGYWSLVWPPVVTNLMVAPVAWIVSRELPLPHFAAASSSYPRGLVAFGGFSTGNALVGYIANNADYLLIGRLLGAEALGFYTFAYTKAYGLSKRVLAAAGEVALPVYAAVSEEKERLQRGFYKGLSAVTLANVPLMGMLAAMAPVLIPVVFGNRWQASVLPFQILCVHVAVNSLTSPIDAVSYAIGRPDIAFKVTAGLVPFLVISYVVGAHFGGIIGVAVAVAAAKSTASIAKTVFVFRVLQWRWRRFGSCAGLSICCALMAAAAAASIIGHLAQMGPLIALPVGALVYATLYLGGMVVFQRDVLESGLSLLFTHDRR